MGRKIDLLTAHDVRKIELYERRRRSKDSTTPLSTNKECSHKGGGSDLPLIRGRQSPPWQQISELQWVLPSQDTKLAQTLDY